MSDPTTTVRPLRQPSDLPGPKGIPIFGNALQIKPQRFHQQLEQWARTYGSTYRLRLGRDTVVVTGDHAAVALALRDRPQGFRRTPRVREIGQEMGLLPSLFGAEGDDWQRQRRMVMASFDPGHVKRYFPSLTKVADRLTGRWRLAAQQGRDIDLQADLMRYTVDTIAGLAFGADVNTLQSDDDVIQRHLDKIFPALNRRMFATFPVWRWWTSPADRLLAQSLVQVKRAVHDFIAQARARLAADPQRREQPGNLLDAMLVAADVPDSGINDTAVAGNVLGMLLAGEDTTANTLAWMIHLLWRHPQALARATGEVRRVIGDASSVTMEHLAALEYVDACASETMRLKPVAPLNGMVALRDNVVGDVQLRAGTMLICLTRHDSLDESKLPAATQFQPDRWLGQTGEPATPAKRLSMPFGAGPRMCPGRYLALLEIKMAIATLLGRFDIVSVDTPDGQEAQERLAFTMTPVGLTMRLRERA